MGFPLEDGDEPDALCCDCGEPLYAEELSVEGYERFNAILCPACEQERLDEEDEDV